MFEHRPQSLYNPKELLYEKYTDFDIMREKPVVFTIGGFAIVIMPVTIKDSPLFIKEMSRVMVQHYEIFQNALFFTAKDYRKKRKITKVVDSITMYANTKSYRRFMKKTAPAFIRQWAYTVDGDSFIRMNKVSRWKVRKAIEMLTPDELIQVFFTILTFNYDIVKKKTAEFLKTLGVDSLTETDHTASSNSTTRNSYFQMPEYSPKPFSEQTLNLLEQQSSTIDKMN